MPDAQKKLLIVGANNPEVVRLFECIQQKHPEWTLSGFLDDNPEKKGQYFMGHEIYGGCETVQQESFRDCYIANVVAKTCAARKDVADRLRNVGAKIINFIHPNVVLKYVTCGTGLYIQESVILQAHVNVKDDVSIHMGSLIGHETSIGEASFIAHGCTISGRVTISTGAYIGAGATILPNITIGEWSIVGAGAVVTKDVQPYTIVAGNPARFLREV
jgi:sugar O-acyltransferase (sialic acid O-acetyltransferase NeuD family)